MVPGSARTVRIQVLITPEMAQAIEDVRGEKRASTWVFDVLRHTLAQCRADRDVAAMLAEPFREE